MAFDSSPVIVPAGRNLFLISTETTETVDEVATVKNGAYLKIETASNQKPNNWSDFSEFCPEPAGQTTVLTIVKDVTTEIDQAFTPKDTDGLMDNFGNVYMAIEIND